MSTQATEARLAPVRHCLPCRRRLSTPRYSASSWPLHDDVTYVYDDVTYVYDDVTSFLTALLGKFVASACIDEC